MASLNPGDNITYDYDYDYNENILSFAWDELAPTLIIYGITMVIGLSGNFLIIFTTYRYRRMQSVTNVLLASLASADLLLITFCIPVKVAKHFSYTWTMGVFLCKSVYYMQNVSAICSVFTLTAISVERYYAIVHPMKARYICTISQAKRIIIITWILSILLAMPTLFTQILFPVGQRYKGFWCVRNWNNKALWKFHELYYLILVLIGPSSIMIFAYSLICWEIWRVMERRSLMTSRKALTRNVVVNHPRIEENLMLTVIKNNGNYKNSDIKKESSKEHTLLNGNERSADKTRSKEDSKIVKQVIYMLVTVVVLFIICWSPVLIENVLTAYEILPDQRVGTLKHISVAFHLMAYFNSCVNPIIYGFMSKHFRESFKAVLCCFARTEEASSRMTNSLRQISRTGSQTRNTSIK